MFKVIFLMMAVAVASPAEHVKYEVSQQQFNQLLEMTAHLNDMAAAIEKDFGSNEVMPRERDRRDFKRDMGDLKNHSTQTVARWIDRVKKSDFIPPVVTPLLPAPAPNDVTLTETFVQTSGFSTFYAADFNGAATAMSAQCAEWRETVKKNTLGSVTIAQCSGPEQVKLEDGNIGAKVTGQIKLSFAQYSGYVAVKSVSATFSNNSGFGTYYAGDFGKAAANSKRQCGEWVSGVRAQSQGLILYTSCGGTQTVKGLGGNLHASVTGTVTYTHRPSKSEANVLNQQFTNNSGFSTYYEGDYNKAAAASRAQCQAWIADTINNSSALPVFASCAGPEPVMNSNLYARYSGQVVLLPK